MLKIKTAYGDVFADLIGTVNEPPLSPLDWGDLFGDAAVILSAQEALIAAVEPAASCHDLPALSRVC